MKTYVKPSMEYIELRAEESLACTGSTLAPTPDPTPPRLRPRPRPHPRPRPRR